MVLRSLGRSGSEMQIPAHTFLITGGSSGLGAGSRGCLSSLGGNVVIADLNEEAGTRLAAELGPVAAFSKTDVTDEAQVQAAIDLAISRFGRLDGVISCAGILGAGGSPEKPARTTCSSSPASCK